MILDGIFKLIKRKRQKQIARLIILLLGLFLIFRIVVAYLSGLGNPMDKKTLANNQYYGRLSQYRNAKLTISQKGVDLIETFEGHHLDTYLDPIGIPTIGYGHIDGVKMGQTITEQQVLDFLYQDIDDKAAGILKYVNTPLTQGEYDALVSFHFNLGREILTTDSVLLNAINSNDWATAKAQILQYYNAGGQKLEGLERRRQAEVALFQDDIK